MFIQEVQETETETDNGHYRDYKIRRIKSGINEDRGYIDNSYKAINAVKRFLLYPSIPLLLYNPVSNFYSNFEEKLMSHVNFLQGFDDISFSAGISFALAGIFSYFLLQINLNTVKKQLKKSEKDLESLL